MGNFLASCVTISFLERTLLHAETFFTVPLGSTSFLCFLLMFALQEICMAFINLDFKLSAVGNYHLGDTFQGVSMEGI